MSTRCNVVFVDHSTRPRNIEGGRKPIVFYRHSDGYPDGVQKTLDTFCEWMREGRIRDNASQSAGWLLLLGVKEYAAERDGFSGKFSKSSTHSLYGEMYVDTELQEMEPCTIDGEGGYSGWKVGAYEPTPGIHSDIDFLHVIDLVSKEWYSVEAPYLDTLKDCDDFLIKCVSECIEKRSNAAAEL